MLKFYGRSKTSRSQVVENMNRDIKSKDSIKTGWKLKMIELGRIRSPRKRRTSFQGGYESLPKQKSSTPKFIRQGSTSSGKRLALALKFFFFHNFHAALIMPINVPLRGRHKINQSRFPVPHFLNPSRFSVPPGSPILELRPVPGSPRFPNFGTQAGSRFPLVPQFSNIGRFPVPHFWNQGRFRLVTHLWKQCWFSIVPRFENQGRFSVHPGTEPDFPRIVDFPIVLKL